MSDAKQDPVMTFDDVIKKTEQFGALLESIENIEDKKKHLWKEIYENAIIDRMNAYMLFTADLISREEEKASQIDPDNLFAQISEK